MSTNRWADDEGVSAGLRERYGLSDDPFAEAPDRFYAGGERQHYLDLLEHLGAFGDMALLITGELGVGRSRLLQEFARRSKQQLDIRELELEDCRSIPDLARRLKRIMRQDDTKLLDPMQAIESFFRSEHWQTYTGRRWVLLLDDADQCPLEVLQALIQGFAAGYRAQAPVPILVCGSETSADLHTAIDVHPPVLTMLAIRPLGLEESQDFVAACFRWAGGDLGGALDDHRSSRLFQVSGGNIARLKQAAPPVLLGRSGPAVARRQIPAGRRLGGLALALAVLLLGVSYLAVSWQYQEPVPVAAVPEAATEVARIREAMEAAERSVRGDEPQDGEGVETEGELQPEHVQSNPAAEEPAAQPAAEPLLPESLGLSVEELLAAELTADSASAALPAEPGTAETEARPAPEEPDQPDAAPAPPSPAVTQSGFEPAAPAYFRDRSWLEAIQPGTLTVQILGSFSEQDAVSTIAKHPGTELMYVKSVHRGRPWFVVLHGLYPDAAAARSALSQLPESLQGSQPWIRSVRGL